MTRLSKIGSLVQFGGLAVAAILLLGATAASESRGSSAATSKNSLAAAEPADALDFAEQNRTVRQYCVRCHRSKAPSGGLSLQDFDLVHVARDPEMAEKIIRKLQAGMMPARPARRPERGVLHDLANALATEVDRAAKDSPHVGGRTFQRLNRAEYQASIHDLLGVEIDSAAFLPADTVSAGFDNIADSQGLSATVMEGYLNAAGEVSRLALGERGAAAQEAKYSVPRYTSQWDQVAGAPFGTRGGVSVEHTFPADGEYRFTMAFFDAPIAFLYGYTVYHDEQIEISIDGERVALLDLDLWMDADNENLQSEPIFVRSGSRRVSAAFLRKIEGPLPDLLSPFEWSLADRTIGAAYGVTTLPHLRDLAISGPYNSSGVSSAPSRERVFQCRPTKASEEIPCAQRIIAGLAEQAYRRPLLERDLEGLLGFYRTASAEGFETGIRAALEAILASPHFIFRLERRVDETSARLDAQALATRLSFFLWGAGPDHELRALAASGELLETDTLAEQIERLLEDPRVDSLASRFAGQWLRLQDLDSVHPNSLLFPDYDDGLAASMRRETELFFSDVLRTDLSAVDLLSANHSFVDERLARHYGLTGVVGPEFRRVSLENTPRRGLLGHGSVLTLTSHADRTSPVLRGKWIMGVLLGSPPPPPPPDVPDLEATSESHEGRLLTVRERMESHRANPACSSCHNVIDPLGLALETFDVTGAERTKDNGAPVDATGEMYDGRELTGAAALREALLDYDEAFVTNLTVNLMSYALGRRIEAADMPEVRRIVDESSEQNYRLKSLVEGVALSPAFLGNERAPGTLTRTQSNDTEATRRRR